MTLKPRRARPILPTSPEPDAEVPPVSTVLIADDAAFMRLTMRGILAGAGYEVVGEAENGAVAVEKYLALRPDLITMDIGMPELDGVAALRRIRAADPGARVVMCSGLRQGAEASESLAAGARDVVVKPLRPDRVIRAAERALAPGPPTGSG